MHLTLGHEVDDVIGHPVNEGSVVTVLRNQDVKLPSNVSQTSKENQFKFRTGGRSNQVDKVGLVGL